MQDSGLEGNKLEVNWKNSEAIFALDRMNSVTRIHGKTAQRCIFVKDERDVTKISVNFRSEVNWNTHGPQKLRNLSVTVLGNCTDTCH
jgi:hypothetical protein